MDEQRRLESELQTTETGSDCAGTLTRGQEEARAIKVSLSKPLKLELTEKSTVKKSFSNVCEIILHDAYIEGKIALNALEGRAYLKGFFWDHDEHPIQDRDVSELRKYICDLYEDVASKENVLQAISIAAWRLLYHPIQTRLNGLKWDGISRIGELFPRYLGAERSEYTTAVTLLLLHGAIQRVFHPGCKFDYCVVLADTKQGTGKSTMCRYLALNDEWHTDGLDKIDDAKKNYEAIRGFWIVEMGEMIATRKESNIEGIKAFISRQTDVYRDPYGIYPESRPRQCVFIGTTNRPQFLPDDKTGNRRFIPLICNGGRAEVHPMEDEAEARAFVEQCYAEAIAIGQRDGWTMVLDRKHEETLRELQEEATPEDSKAGMIQKYLDEHDEIRYVCTRMIYQEVFKPREGQQPEKYELQDIANIMSLKIIGWRRYRGKKGESKTGQVRFDAYGTQRAWERVVNADEMIVNSSKGFLPSVDNEEPF